MKRSISAIIPKEVAVVDENFRRVDMLDLMDLLNEVNEEAKERQGEKGDPGPSGKDGLNGLDGKDGKPGERGPQGMQGPSGKDGLNGKDGLPGMPGGMPEHEINEASSGIRFKRPDGSWGAWVKAPKGERGRAGPFGGGGDIPNLVGTRPPSDDSDFAASTAWVRVYVASIGAGDMTKLVYDTDDDGIVDVAELANAAPWAGLTGVPATFPPEAHTQAASTITDFSTAADARVAAGISTHEAAGDPHPQYLTSAEGSAAYSAVGHSHSGLAPTGGTTDQVLKKNSATNYDYSWQDDETGAAGAAANGTATVDFGAHPGTSEASIAITGQAAIASGAVISARFAADDTSADHTASDHRYAAALIHLTCTAATAGVGFTIHARCLDKMTGDFTVRWNWNN